MADLGLNTLVDAVKNLANSATGGYDKMVDFIEAFRSDDTNNPFGTAALEDIGTEQGDVAALDTGGTFDDGVLPDGTISQKGIVELLTQTELRNQVATPDITNLRRGHSLCACGIDSDDGATRRNSTGIGCRS